VLGAPRDLPPVCARPSEHAAGATLFLSLEGGTPETNWPPYERFYSFHKCNAARFERVRLKEIAVMLLRAHKK